MKSAPANIHKKCFKRSSFRDIFFNCLSVTISFKVWACVTLGIYFGILVFPRTSFFGIPKLHTLSVQLKRKEISKTTPRTLWQRPKMHSKMNSKKLDLILPLPIYLHSLTYTFNIQILRK